MHLTLPIGASSARLFLVSTSLGSLDYPGSNLVYMRSSWPRLIGSGTLQLVDDFYKHLEDSKAEAS
jgi:hypothetical protein